MRCNFDLLKKSVLQVLHGVTPITARVSAKHLEKNSVLHGVTNPPVDPAPLHLLHHEKSHVLRETPVTARVAHQLHQLHQKNTSNRKRINPATAVEPHAPAAKRPSVPLAGEEETAIRAWFASIGEADPATIAEAIGRCRIDAGAREYLIGRAAELPGAASSPDDRRACGQCANLRARQCLAAMRGEIAARRDYEPVRDIPRRCEGYAPGDDDPDRRQGRQRWPGLTDTKGTK